jgi:hypothetical protein
MKNTSSAGDRETNETNQGADRENDFVGVGSPTRTERSGTHNSRNPPLRGTNVICYLFLISKTNKTNAYPSRTERSGARHPMKNTSSAGDRETNKMLGAAQTEELFSY